MPAARSVAGVGAGWGLRALQSFQTGPLLEKALVYENPTRCPREGRLAGE